MDISIELLRKNPANTRVLKYIESLSAHSDIAEVLLNSVKPLGDVQIYCPDAQAYRYILVSTNNVIFGVAFGMSALCFRLDPVFKTRAMQTGATDVQELDGDWVSFERFYHESDWPKVDSEFWARKAYVYARG
ncbi:MAG: hypothetical protein HQL20_06775 [Candidatus Omnitrophica bacterium]|nr:hypothetical protein [Candidatus Omnitrophota bacterium]